VVPVGMVYRQNDLEFYVDYYSNSTDYIWPGKCMSQTSESKYI